MKGKQKNQHIYTDNKGPENAVQLDIARIVEALKKRKVRIVTQVIPKPEGPSLKPTSPPVESVPFQVPPPTNVINTTESTLDETESLPKSQDEKVSGEARSKKFPKTAFTFQVLETFHQLLLSTKITTYDYYDSLKKTTNHAFPQDVEDRYRELMAVMRIWRHLTQCRYCGQEHDINAEFDHREAGSLAIRCPACPEPGFNVDIADIMNALSTNTHTLTLFLSLDGNYRLNQKFKNTDPNDVALNKGNAYFVDNNVFQQYLQLHDDKATQNSTCSKLKAVRQQQMIKFADSVYSGVVATQCACHGLYLPQGIVNLERGETYVPSQFKTFTCLTNISRYVRTDYALARMTCGEGIESAWAEQNHAAGSTKEQSTGHRQDSLDDFNNYWNWSKVHRMSHYLLSQYVKYSDELQDQNIVFHKLTSRFPTHVIQEWEKLWDDTEKAAKKEAEEAQSTEPGANQPAINGLVGEEQESSTTKNGGKMGRKKRKTRKNSKPKLKKEAHTASVFQKDPIPIAKSSRALSRDSQIRVATAIV
ncbi:hypothetical protein NP233_g5031 [Leucocoprinus birnbaumii]|uniref:CxC2-like cysteine cluster KDZ transposase-associated domain-containing protein n=1 Tax=Leucocoprinus birnbaumii TaxID=56174 RepID=A0AAD5VV08_9AGAR|nr:hypothetical protein NP233_g5031 [Leucocoprinus birnbaumii]